MENGHAEATFLLNLYISLYERALLLWLAELTNSFTGIDGKKLYQLTLNVSLKQKIYTTSTVKIVFLTKMFFVLKKKKAPLNNEQSNEPE